MQGFLDRIDGAIFDCDGTLLDSLGGWLEAEGYLAQQSGIQLTRDQRCMLATLTTPETAAWFHENYGLGDSTQDVIAMIDSFMLDFYRKGPAVKPGVIPFLDALEQRGVPMSIASSTPHDQLEAGLEATGLRKYFQHVVSVDDVGAPKRFPVIYNHCRQLMGTDLERTWGFEDAIYAVRTLVGAGFPTVAVWERTHPFEWDELSAEATIAVKTLDLLLP